MAVPGAALADLLESAARLFDPGDCFFCGAAAGGRAWCRACDRRLSRLEGPVCPACSLPLPAGADHLCPDCLKRPPAFDRTLALLVYEGLAARLVREIKYNCRLFLLRALIAGDLCLRDRLACWAADADLAVPVPLYRSRLLARGYNQSLLIAGTVFAGTGVAVDPLALERTRKTASQTNMSGAGRRRNLRGAFAAAGERVEGKKVVLVDDVMTTGATAAECGRALLRAGAAGVRVLVLARTP